MARKIIQIAACGVDNVQATQCNDKIFALCSDGTLWVIRNTDSEWYQVPEIQDAPEIKDENFNSTQQPKPESVTVRLPLDCIGIKTDAEIGKTSAI